MFNGLGLHKTVKAKLIVDNSVTPIAQKPRKIPYNLEKKVKEEEQRLMGLGIIEEVPDSEPTTWWLQNRTNLELFAIGRT